jgi:hypothetical protein
MATRNEIQALTGKALFDNGFRQRLIKSPKKAAAELKIELTRQEIKYIKSLDQNQIEQIARDVQVLTHTESGAVHWG